MNIESTLRKIAKENRSLNLFVSAKEIHGIQIFKNICDFSKLQDIYLSYLYFYYNLHIDISSKKVSEIVLKDMIYEDSYTLWKTKKEDNKSTSLVTQPSKRAINLVFEEPKTKEK